MASSVSTLAGHGLPPQVGDELAGKVTPVTLAQQPGGDNRLMVRLGDDFASPHRAAKVTRHKGVKPLTAHFVPHLLGLFYALGVELTLRLPLEYLCRIGHRFAVTNEI
jgi:hypothetical protein